MNLQQLHQLQQILYLQSMLAQPRSTFLTNMAIAALIVGAVVYMAFSMYPAFTTGSPDRTTFRYCGMLLSQGGILYKDVFDNKPPLLQLLYAGAHKISYYASWYMMIGFVSLAAICLWRAAIHRSIAFAWLWAILFAGLMYQPWLCHGGEVSRQYTACLQMICLCSLCFRHPLAYMATGFSFIWTGLIVPTEATVLLPAVVYRFFAATDAQQQRKRWLLVSGAAIGLLPSAVYLTVTHTWQECWEQAFVFNRDWYQAAGEFKEKFQVLYSFTRSLHFVWIALLVSAVIAVRFLLQSYKHTEAWLLIAIYFFLLLQLGVWGSARYLDAAYFFAVIPVVCAALLFAWTPLLHRLQPLKHRLLALAFITTTIVATGSPFFYRMKPITTKTGYLLQQLPQLKEVQGQPGQIYVYGGYAIAELNVRLNVPSPSRWFALTPWLYWPERWDADGSEMQENIRRIEAARCRFIIDGSGKLQLPHQKAQQLLQQYLQANYSPQKIAYQPADSILVWTRLPDRQ